MGVRARTCTLACMLAACVGCTGQNFYTTPRTLGDDRGQAILAPQVVLGPNLAVGCDDSKPPHCVGESSALPLLHAAYRKGVGERGEVGLHGGVDAFGFDAKWNAIRSTYVDLALAGRLSIALYSLHAHRLETSTAQSGALLHLPVMLGFNAGSFTFVASPGYTAVGDATGRLTHALRIGAGVQARISSGFALMPEASLLHDVHGPIWLDSVTLGLGFLFPNLPDSSTH